MSFPISLHLTSIRNLRDCYSLCASLSQECILFEIRKDYKRAYKKWMNLHTFITSSITSFKRLYPKKFQQHNDITQEELAIFQNLMNLDKRATNRAHFCFERVLEIGNETSNIDNQRVVVPANGLRQMTPTVDFFKPLPKIVENSSVGLIPGPDVNHRAYFFNKQKAIRQQQQNKTRPTAALGAYQKLTQSKTMVANKIYPGSSGTVPSEPRKVLSSPLQLPIASEYHGDFYNETKKDFNHRLSKFDPVVNQLLDFNKRISIHQGKDVGKQKLTIHSNKSLLRKSLSDSNLLRATITGSVLSDDDAHEPFLDINSYCDSVSSNSTNNDLTDHQLSDTGSNSSANLDVGSKMMMDAISENESIPTLTVQDVVSNASKEILNSQVVNSQVVKPSTANSPIIKSPVANPQAVSSQAVNSQAVKYPVIDSQPAKSPTINSQFVNSQPAIAQTVESPVLTAPVIKTSFVTADVTKPPAAKFPVEDLSDFVPPLIMNRAPDPERSSIKLKELMNELSLERGNESQADFFEDTATILTELEGLVNNESQSQLIDFLQLANPSQLGLSGGKARRNTIKSVYTCLSTEFSNSSEDVASFSQVPFSEIPHMSQRNSVPMASKSVANRSRWLESEIFENFDFGELDYSPQDSSFDARSIGSASVYEKVQSPTVMMKIPEQIEEEPELVTNGITEEQMKMQMNTNGVLRKSSPTKSEKKRNSSQGSQFSLTKILRPKPKDKDTSPEPATAFKAPSPKFSLRSKRQNRLAEKNQAKAFMPLGQTLNKFNNQVIETEMYGSVDYPKDTVKFSTSANSMKNDIKSVQKLEKIEEMKSTLQIKPLPKAAPANDRRFEKHVASRDDKSILFSGPSPSSPSITYLSSTSYSSSVMSPSSKKFRKRVYTPTIASASTSKTPGLKKKHLKEKVEKVLQEANEQLDPDITEKSCRAMMKLALHSDSKSSLNDLVGVIPPATKQSLKEKVILPFVRPDLFDSSEDEPVKSVLLAGPAGNRLGLVAKAVAKDTKCLPLVVDASHLAASEKMVKSFFYVAKKMSPVTLVIENIDILLNKNGDIKTKAVFLREWRNLMRSTNPTDSILVPSTVNLSLSDLINSEYCRVLLIATSSNPWNIGDVSHGLFDTKVYLPTPDSKSRKAYLKVQTEKFSKSSEVTLTDKDYETIASQTESYSIEDLCDLIKEASMIPLRELQDDIIKLPKEAIRPLEIDDLYKTLREIKSSVSLELTSKFESWQAEYVKL